MFQLFDKGLFYRYLPSTMGKNKKIKKSFISIFEQIEEHFVKIENAKNIGNIDLVKYYKIEIEIKFIGELYKKIKKKQKNKTSAEVEEKILYYKKKLLGY